MSAPARERVEGHDLKIVPRTYITLGSVAWQGVLYDGMEVIQRCPDCKVIPEKDSADAGRIEQKPKSKKRDFEKGGYFGR